jgi:hypothetical protein
MIRRRASPSRISVPASTAAPSCDAEGRIEHTPRAEDGSAAGAKRCALRPRPSVRGLHAPAVAADHSRGYERRERDQRELDARGHHPTAPPFRSARDRPSSIFRETRARGFQPGSRRTALPLPFHVRVAAARKQRDPMARGCCSAGLAGEGCDSSRERLRLTGPERFPCSLRSFRSCCLLIRLALRD